MQVPHTREQWRTRDRGFGGGGGGGSRRTTTTTTTQSQKRQRPRRTRGQFHRRVAESVAAAVAVASAEERAAAAAKGGRSGRRTAAGHTKTRTTTTRWQISHLCLRAVCRPKEKEKERQRAPSFRQVANFFGRPKFADEEIICFPQVNDGHHLLSLSSSSLTSFKLTLCYYPTATITTFNTPTQQQQRRVSLQSSSNRFISKPTSIQLPDSIKIFVLPFS